MTFISPILCTQSRTPQPQLTRRRILAFALAAAAASSLPPKPCNARTWQPEQLCPNCGGCGKQKCSFCEGTGLFNIDDTFVDQTHVCPNCQGIGTLRCPSCIGLGLAKTNGILRNAARDGSLRMLRNGNYEILDCSAFPACDIYGAEQRGQL